MNRNLNHRADLETEFFPTPDPTCCPAQPAKLNPSTPFHNPNFRQVHIHKNQSPLLTEFPITKITNTRTSPERAPKPPIQAHPKQLQTQNLILPVAREAGNHFIMHSSYANNLTHGSQIQAPTHRKSKGSPSSSPYVQILEFQNLLETRKAHSER